MSHGHGADLIQLLQLLARPGGTHCRRVWVTLNIPEPEVLSVLQPGAAPGDYTLNGLTVRVICNAAPLGFGANHNQAFARERLLPDAARFFVVINPDITWQHAPWAALLAQADLPHVGCVYPVQMDAEGREQDSQRMLPTPLALWRRYARKGGEGRPGTVHVPDWVNAALLLFSSEVYDRIGGFDTRYHMYCEDVDICLRVQLAGYRLQKAPDARVTHGARRASRREWRHFVWHVRSLLRLWTSEPYAQFRKSRN